MPDPDPVHNYRCRHIDLGLELLANARHELGTDAPLSNCQIAKFITDVTGQPVTPESIGNDARRALAKLQRHAPRYQALENL